MKLKELKWDRPTC